MHEQNLTGAVHHIEINVSDLHRSAEFWGWLLGVLGYNTYQQWESGKSWILRNTYIVIVQTQEDYLHHSYHRCGTGLNHIAFHATSREIVDAIATQLRERGATMLYEDRYPNAGGGTGFALFFEDPDRMKIEIVAPVNNINHG